jgi:hypothetical protein
MSPRSAQGEQGRGGRMALSALLLVLVALAMLLIVRARPTSEAFDPRSGNADGARGLVLLLQHFGATVDIVREVPAAGAGERIVVLQDRLDGAQRAALATFVKSGGVVVLADRASSLAGGKPASPIATSAPPAVVTDASAEADVRPGNCDIAALSALRGLYVPEGVRFTVAPGESQCFENGGAAFVVARPMGAGTLVVLGDNRLWTNAYLRYADNGGLATALLAPTPTSHVAVLLGSQAAPTAADIGTGDRTLSDLIRPGVWMALAQLGIAFVIFAFARGVRPGRPVREPAQVPVAGSELVVATGSLMQRAQHASRAGWLLRAHLYRELCTRMRVPNTTSIADLDAVVSERTGLAPGALAAVLQRDVTDDQQLLQLGAQLQSVRDVALERTTDPLLEGASQ